MLLGTVVSIKVNGVVEYKGQSQTLLELSGARTGKFWEIILAATCRMNSRKENLKKKKQNKNPDW